MSTTNNLVYFLIVLSFEIASLQSKDCSYIKNAKVYVNFALFAPFVPLENTYEKTISGCIEDSKFINNKTTRIGINCTETEITTLEKNSLRNMVQLQTAYIFSCPVEKIEPFAFTNIPRLEMIGILHGRIKEIRRGIFDKIPTVKQIILRDHEIEYVEDYALGDLPELSVVDLSYNNLRYLSTNWFTNSTAMKQLYISYNFITTIRQGAFQYIPNLKYVFMAHNKLISIDSGAFEGLSELFYLDLGHNQLTTISSNIFPNDLSLGYVNLERNLLNFFSTSFLTRIIKDRGGSVKIIGNPLKCTCLDKIDRWMYEEKVEARLVVLSYTDAKNCYKPYTLPICGVSKSSSKFCTDDVDTELTERYVQVLGKYFPLECS